MSNKKLKFAVVGCGNLAMKYSIPALMNSGVSEIAICVDPNRRGQKEAIKEKFNLPLVTLFDQAIKEYEFDAVYIASPTGTHKDIVIEAAKNGKQILCEKSLGSDLSEVLEMVESCKKYGMALFEGFMYQFHTQHQFVRDLIKKGEIGEPFHLEARFGFPPIHENDFRYKKSSGGGVVLDAGSYTVHVARKFFGLEPVNALAVLENEGKEVEIRGTALLNFGESRTASLIFGFNNMYQSRYQIWGTKGMITLERAYALPPDFKPTCPLEKQGYREVFTLDACDHFIEEIKYFCSNYHVNEVKEDWYNEAINQSKALHSLF